MTSQAQLGGAVRCSRRGCNREAHWRPILHVPIARSAERELVPVMLPVAFCAWHHLSERTAAKLTRSAQLEQTLASRLGHGWRPELRKAWVRSTRIASDRSDASARH